MCVCGISYRCLFGALVFCKSIMKIDNKYLARACIAGFPEKLILAGQEIRVHHLYGIRRFTTIIARGRQRFLSRNSCPVQSSKLLLGPPQHSRSWCRVFWNDGSSSKRGGVWLVLVTPSLQGSDSAGSHFHLLNPLTTPETDEYIPRPQIHVYYVFKIKFYIVTWRPEETAIAKLRKPEHVSTAPNTPVGGNGSTHNNRGTIGE
jgi:hypothetical protein